MQTLTVLPDYLRTAAWTRLVRLPHPSTGGPALFLLYKTAAGDGILELQAIKPDEHEKRSWFVGKETVCSDGRLLLFTPIDAVYLLVRVLEAAQSTNKSFLPLGDIFGSAADHLGFTGKEAEDFVLQSSDIAALEHLTCVQGALEKLCDARDLGGELKAYRLSERRLCDYLAARVEMIARSPAFATCGALVSGLSKAGIHTSEDCLGGPTDISDIVKQQAREQIAIQLLSQYLSPEHQTLLRDRYKHEELAQHLERDSITAELLTHMPGLRKPLAHENSNPSEGLPDGPAFHKTSSGAGLAAAKKKAKPLVSSGVARLAKVNTSRVHKLSSFFTKKGTPPSAGATPESESQNPLDEVRDGSQRSASQDSATKDAPGSSANEPTSSVPMTAPSAGAAA
ncbi:uncharacterized protein L969DRAFT_89337 [Mixia osmundae IAM 14324]|uniref:Ribonuclease H2 subunit B n=1 Tax=Mixia osmundae (strain CBS 9802 / IAM 14324 / JCM 22182 / KY 12970) TaxID=764103 RepID=G7DX10_MIXOS|nr:uncharacterized protein L969DRAFT_89337 [Mixia osmundae IAM 14324]KEI38084.1 hypothetical protein L969DRAFT_89337 [Mixia osmundae IAM 14324]GAA95107.1 hypothetical protein E5Q_01762 [Mixia osmundae IAM 14324]